jgi:anti-sigma regulatory factor (Ser/Thr protein kinase)
VITLSVAQDQLLLKFHTDITFVDVALEIIRHVLEYQTNEDPTNLLLVSRELLKNAVVHGNQNDRAKEVIFRLSRIGYDLWKLEAQDSGPGISQRQQRIIESDHRQAGKRGKSSGRGFTIISNLAEQVLFNPTGNVITVLLRV